MEWAKRLHVGVITAVFIAVLIVGYITAAFTRILPSATITATPIAPATSNALQPFSWPGHGQAAVAMVGDPTIHISGEQKPVPTASVAKIITALVVLKNHPLTPGESGPTITMTAADVASYQMFKVHGGSTIPVVVGETFTEYQMLQGLLLPSANNFAESLAIWACGSLTAYTAQAQQLAKTLGMDHSTFTDPSGFLPSTLSTASDIVSAGKAALQNPVITSIASQKTAILPIVGTVKNVNWLLGTHGITGLKTGNSDEADGCFLFAASHQVAGKTVTIVGAILGDTNLQTALNDSIPLLESARANIEATHILYQGQIVGMVHSAWGSNSPAVAAESLTNVQWRGTVTTLQTKMAKVHEVTNPSEHVGTITLKNGTNTLQKVPVVLSTPLTGPSWQWRLLHAL